MSGERPKPKKPEGVDDLFSRLPPKVREIVEGLRKRGPQPSKDPYLLESSSEEELVERLPEAIREALQNLHRAKGREIAERLQKDEELSHRFLVDPIGALTALGIDIPPVLQRIERPSIRFEEAVEGPTVRLPGGQKVTPRVRIRFTEGEGR